MSLLYTCWRYFAGPLTVVTIAAGASSIVGYVVCRILEKYERPSMGKSHVGITPSLIAACCVACIGTFCGLGSLPFIFGWKSLLSFVGVTGSIALIIYSFFRYKFVNRRPVD